MRVLTTLVTVASLVATARADKFKHVVTAQPHGELSASVKPPPVVAKAAAAPTLDGGEVLAIQGLLGSVHIEQEHILAGLVASTPDDDPDKADYLARLGEIYAKEQRTARLLATQAEIAAQHETDPAAKKQQLATAATQHDASHQALLGSVKTYRALIANPGATNYARMDSALFGLAYVLHSGGYAKEAREVYQKLIVDHPASRYVVEAYFALGEGQFEAGQLAEAAQLYGKVLQFPQSGVYWFARYKLGWIQLNQKATADALATFFAVAQGTKSGNDNLHRAALHDFVRAYAEAGKADKALAAFRRVDSAGALGMLATLADFYVEQGQGDRAIYTLRELMHEQPKSPKVCEWETTVAREMPIAGTRNDVVHEVQQLVKLQQAIALPANEARDCREAAAEMSGQLARAYHQEAVKTQNPELIVAAEALYGTYLHAFPDAPDYAETQYFHAELAWTLADSAHNQPRLWEQAGEAFTSAVQTGKLDAKLTKVAADAAMLAWMRALAVDPTKHGGYLGAEKESFVVKAARPLPPSETKLLAAFDLYLAHVTDKNDDELADVTFQRAELLRKFDHLPEAIAGFESILAQHRDCECAEDAAQLALDSYNRLERYDDMLALATKLSSDAKFLSTKPALEKTLTQLHRTALRKLAEGEEADGKRTGDLAKYVACGTSYVDLYNSDPLAADGDQLLYDAGLCFDEGKSLSAARQMFELLQKLFPKSTLAARSVARLGDDYAQTASYREAAVKLEEYASRFAAHDETGSPRLGSAAEGQRGPIEDAYRALSDAVTFRKGIGDDAQAIADTELFVARFGAKHPAAAADAAWTLTAIYDKQGDLEKVSSHLRAWLAKYGAAASADRVVIAWARIGDAEWKRACPVATVDGTCARVTRAAPVRLAIKQAVVGTRCSEDKVETVAVARDGKRVAAAMAAYDKAIATYDAHGGVTGGDERGARYYYASSKLGRAERDFEAYLAQTIPSGLDFDPRSPAIAAKSKARFTSWLTSKSAAGVATRAQYDAVTKLGDGATTISAVARMGQLTHTLSGQLFRAEIPRNLRTGPYAEESSQAYCDQLTTVAEPLETDAIASYRGCLATSTRLGWFSDMSRLCERELGQLDPTHYPTTSELRRTPDLVSRIGDVEPAAKL
jgi:TolA-binding protein